MPIKKNNNKVCKAFAIGTKITYNDKLYEVVESVNCADCSLANICSSSVLSPSDRNDDTLSKDERIRIFGACSSVRRPDDKSIVFVEVTEDTSDDNCYKITPLFTDSNHIQLRPIKFALPNGCEIDIEASDLSKGIVRFKRKWLTLEQIYKLAEENDYLTNRSAIKEYRDGKLVAIANLMDIARYFNGDWNYTASGNDCGYIIAYDKTTTEPYGYQIVHINADTDMYFGNITFKNEADAKYVIDNPNFRTVLDKIFKS